MERNTTGGKKSGGSKSTMERFAKMNTLREDEQEEQSEQDELFELEEPTRYAHVISPLLEEDEPEEEPEMEHFGETIQFNVNLSVDDMFRFMLRHAYFGITGIVGVGISLAAVVMLIMGMGKNSSLSQLMLVFAALLFTVINPLLIWVRARRQARAVNVDNAPYTYIFSGAGIEVRRKEECVYIKWDNIIKVREGKTNIYMYLALNRAFVLPHGAYPNKDVKLRELILSNVNVKRCKLKQA